MTRRSPITLLHEMAKEGQRLVREATQETSAVAAAAKVAEALAIAGHALELTTRRDDLWITKQVWWELHGGLTAGSFAPGAEGTAREAWNALSARLDELEEMLPPILTTVSTEVPTPGTFFKPRGTQPMQPATPADQRAVVAAAEARLQVRLPGLLRQLYLIQDGGETEFHLAATREDPAHVFEGDKQWEQWANVILDGGLLKAGGLNTFGWFSDQGYAPDDSDSWRVGVEEPDRLVVISTEGWFRFLCLDYRGTTGGPPSVRLVRPADPDVAIMTEFEAPSFEDLFARLRRFEPDEP